MKQSLEKNTLMIALITGSVIWGGTSVYAEEPEQVFTLDPMIVTATRTEKRDLDVPATTSIYTSKQLEATGATTVEGALKYATGIVYKSETAGDGGGEFLIRGKRRGTMVLVDGIPLNVRTGYYDLDRINIADVERIEVVRGGGAVLYGSDATGGVINIITKNKRTNSVSATVGNYGVQKYATSLQAGKLGIGASWNKKGNIYHTSEGDKYFNFLGGEKTILSMNYKFDDAWRVTADYNNYDYKRSYNQTSTGLPTDKRFLDKEEYKFVLSYHKDGWNANAFYHKSSSDTKYHYWKNNIIFKDAYFYGNNGSYEVVQRYQRAWLLHIHRNPHHWQHWVLIHDDMEDGELETVLEMPYDYIIEMICDWWSFSWQSENLYEIFKWYEEHSKYIKLAQTTKITVEYILDNMKKKLQALQYADQSAMQPGA